MYIRNIQKESIGPHTFGGFEFIIPTGVSAIYDSAGKHLTEKIYRVETKKPGPVDKGGDGGAPIPPIILATRSEWEDDGCKYAEVKRFKIDATRLPNRNYLIDLAEKYGVDKEEVAKFRTNSEIENVEIAQAINKLPVPEDVRIPERE